MSIQEDKQPLLNHVDDDSESPLLRTVGEADETASSLKRAAVEEEDANKTKMLVISFLIMLVVGLANKIFQKLQTLPMHDYPYMLSLGTTFIYIPASFAYIFPMIWFGKQITKEQRAIPKYKFGIMGALDGIAGVMQVFATNFITSGGLLILLQQSAIPISMVITKYMLKAKYQMWNYVGALVVVLGLAVVLTPQVLKPDKDEPPLFWMWVGVMLLSCVPMTLSSVYKEKALGETDIDVVYLNGWVALFQFLLTIALAVPMGYVNDPVITPSALPGYLLDGWYCYIGAPRAPRNPLDPPNAGWCVSKPISPLSAPLTVNIYMLFNIVYNIVIILILKYGSSNILWLAMTLMVPLGNIAFALPFVPGHKPLTYFDGAGLLIIIFGLFLYRFWSMFTVTFLVKREREWLAERGWGPAIPVEGEAEDAETESEREGSVRYPLLGSRFNSIEIADPIYVVSPERKLLRTQHQIRSNYFARLGIQQHDVPREDEETVHKTVNIV